jgi:eukaryotic-like serine/threonine-protein kinase
MLWDTNDGRKISTYTSPTDSLPVWSLDGKRFSSIEENRVYVWDASNGATIYTYRGHSGAVGPFAWSPDGKHIASGDKGEIHVWDASNGTTICTYRGHSSPVSLLAWSPNGKRIASVGEDGVHVWQVAV